MKFYLIRHGNTKGNVDKLYYGSTDLPLLDESIRDLKRVTLPGISKYYISGMIRTRQTLECLFGNVEYEVENDLREMDFGDFEMRTYDDLKNDPAFQKWASGNVESNVCPNGESGVEVTARAEKALMRIIERGEDCAIVAHGGVIGGVLSKWFPSEKGRFTWTPQPGTGYVITVENGVPVSCELAQELMINAALSEKSW